MYNNQDQWAKVRKMMSEQLEEDKIKYKRILGGDDELEKVKISIRFENSKTATKKYWFSKLDMGQLCADTFNRPVSLFCLSKNDCHTYLPFVKTLSSSNHCPIMLCFVDSSHWILLIPKSSNVFPIPPLHLLPSAFFKKNTIWKKCLEEGVDLFFDSK